MTITVPNLRPTSLRSFEVDFASTIAEAIWRRIVQALNFYNDAVPVGLVMPFYQSQKYANLDPIPNPTAMWQFCDGAPVANAASPLFGQSVPDLRSVFHKGWSSIGASGGAASLNLSHNHSPTGTTDDTSFGQWTVDAGEERRSGTPHYHEVNNALGAQNLIPPFIELQPYMRVDGANALDTALMYPGLEDALGKFGEIVSVELLQSIKAGLDYVKASLPVGEVVPIMTNIPGVSINPKIWQECDGSEITDPDSPLHSIPGLPRYTPNLVGRYVKFPVIGLVGSTGGQNTRNDLGHGHGGYTGATGYESNADSDAFERFEGAEHFHTIPGAWEASTFNIEPPYRTVKFYMRIQ